MRPLVLVLVAGGLATSLAGCRRDAPAPPPERTSIPFRIDGELSFLRGRPDGGTDTLHTIAIEVADTDSTRTRGLMERRTIPPDTGMLFVFPAESPQSFWMSNTPHALDIQYYAADSTLVSVAENAVPFSTETLPSAAPAQFVVEVAAGITRRLGLVEGDRIAWRLDRDAGAPADGIVDSR